MRFGATVAGICLCAALSAAPARAIHPDHPLLGRAPWLDLPLSGASIFPLWAIGLADGGLKAPWDQAASLASAASSGDGALIALGDSKGKAGIIDARTGKLLLSLALGSEGGWTGPVRVSLTPDGRWLLVLPADSEELEIKPELGAEACLVEVDSRRSFPIGKGIVDWSIAPDSSFFVIARKGRTEYGRSVLGFEALSLPSLKLSPLDLPTEGYFKMLASSPVALSGIRVSSPTTVVGRFVIDGRLRFVAWSLTDGALLATEDFDPYLFFPPPSPPGLADSLSKAVLRKDLPPLILIDAQSPIKVEAKPAPSTYATMAGSVAPIEVAPPWLRDFGEWRTLAASETAARKVGGAASVRTLILCQGENDAAAVRIRREGIDGSLIADRTLRLGDAPGGGSNNYTYIEGTTIASDGSLLLLARDEDRAAASVRVAADLSGAELLRLEVESGNTMTFGSSTLFFDPTHWVYPDGVFEDVLFDGDAGRALRLSWTSVGTDEPDRVALCGSTRTALFFGLWLNVRENPFSSPERLIALAVFDWKGRVRANLLLTGGEDEELDEFHPAAWDLSDGTTVFLTSYRAIQPVTRQMSAWALRVICLDQRGGITSLLLPPPAALAGLPEENASIDIDAAGVTVRKTGKFRGEPLPGEPLRRLLWKRNAKGEPDPRLGFEGARLAKATGSSDFHDARLIWPAAGGGYAVIGFDDSNSELLEYDPGEPPLVLPDLAQAVLPKERRSPDISDHGWINLKVTELPLEKSSLKLEDTEVALAKLSRLALQAAPRRGPLAGDLAFLNDSRVRVRTAPNLSAPVIAQLDAGAAVLVLERGAASDVIGGRSAPWFKVELTDGRTGWIFSAFLDATEKGAP